MSQGPFQSPQSDSNYYSAPQSGMGHMPTDLQRASDENHLSVLSILHFVNAGLFMLGVAISGFYFFIFRMLLNDPKFRAELARNQARNGPSPEVIFEYMQYFILGMVIVTLLIALANLFSGFFLRSRKNRIFTLITATVNCLFIPLGTLLGIFTFIVVCRASVMQLYRQKSIAQDPWQNPGYDPYQQR